MSCKEVIDYKSYAANEIEAGVMKGVLSTCTSIKIMTFVSIEAGLAKAVLSTCILMK